MTPDPSRGWDAIARDFIAARTDRGVEIVRQWATQLPPAAAVLDVGCGSGAPIAETLVAGGFRVFGVDAAPTLVAEFRRRLPSAEVVCEPAETSRLFDRRFDGAVAIGLVFLLPADDQRAVIARVAAALEPGARFLFTAPRQACDWTDSLTGQPSLSLGEVAYRQTLEQAGLRLVDQHTDAGGNHYFDALRPPG
ncbi:MAG: class I SAM-dependent methyltransferase [Pseudomonadota bacterium]|nr:class I SAM-dependent methyltransferase [Pseudomonadota bacterium]